MLRPVHSDLHWPRSCQRAMSLGCQRAISLGTNIQFICLIEWLESTLAGYNLKLTMDEQLCPYLGSPSHIHFPNNPKPWDRSSSLSWISLRVKQLRLPPILVIWNIDVAFLVVLCQPLEIESYWNEAVFVLLIKHYNRADLKEARCLPWDIFLRVDWYQCAFLFEIRARILSCLEKFEDAGYPLIMLSMLTLSELT